MKSVEIFPESNRKRSLKLWIQIKIIRLFNACTLYVDREREREKKKPGKEKWQYSNL